MSHQIEPLTPHTAPSSFEDELARIWRDPEIWKLALRRAGNRELAEDALQEAYYSIARAEDHGHINNLRAYFQRTLINQIGHLRGQLGPIPVEDLDALVRSQRPGALPSASNEPGPDEAAVWRQLAADWQERFRRELERLQALVPDRSPDPVRYRNVIVEAADSILGSAGDGHVNWTDSDAALRAAYPDWFSDPSCSRDTRYQRCSRARHDVRTLLMVVVHRDEL